MEATVVFKSYDKSSGVSLRSSKVSSIFMFSALDLLSAVTDEDPHDPWPEESQDY